MANAASFHPGEHHSNEQRRRSTRIAQALPLIVRGMDLLGQPFEERTTTMVFSVHGCKYPSKHHLPKNTWVTLEAPQRESSTGPECVRARVVWIQRPHTVRELFQIAVELESPANIWGLAAPPEDWQQSSSVAPQTNLEEEERVSALLTPTQLNEGRQVKESDETPAGLADFMESLLSAARKHDDESQGQSPSAGSRTAESEGPLIRELRAQVERHAVQPVEDAAAKAKEEIERGVEKIQQESAAHAETFYERWKEEFERASSAARSQLSAELAERIASSREEVRADLKTDLETNFSGARDLILELDRRLEALRSELGSVEFSTATLAQMRLQIDAMSAALEERANLQEESQVEKPPLAANVLVEWRQRLAAEMELARGQWNELLQSSLDSAMQSLLSRVAEGSQSALESAEQQMGARLDDLKQPTFQAVTEARELVIQLKGTLDQELASARAALEEIEQTASRLKEGSAQFEAAAQDTLNQLHRRLEKTLSTLSGELNRRADALATGLGQRVAPVLESTAQELIARTISELQSKIGPHVERVPELLRELSAHELQAEESLRLHRERLRQSAENIRRESDSQRETILAELRKDFEDAKKEALAKWVEELDASGARASNVAAESMVKTSEWHLQQAQGRMQALVEDSLVAGREILETRAQEVAQEFAAELERQRSGQAEQLYAQLQRSAAEVIEGSRSQIEQAAQAAAASFGQVLGGISGEALERFQESSRTVALESAAQLERSAEQSRSNLEAGARASLENFGVQLSAQAEQNVADVKERFRAESGAAIDSFHSRREEVQQEWRAGLDELSRESAEKYQERLQTASDSWMMGSVRKLNEHGQNVIESLTRASEHALRNSFARVFDGLSQMMRESLVSSSGAASSSAAAAGMPTGEASASETEKHTQG